MTLLATSVLPVPASRRLPAGPALLVFLAMLALLLAGAEQLLNDPDTQWHIAVGRDIWRTATFPTVDLYSHTFRGAPWIAKEWLAQVSLFLAQAAGGWMGVALLAALLAALAFAGLFRWLSQRLQPVFALALTAVAVSLASPQILARPHIFLPGLLVIWVGGLLRAVEDRRGPNFALISIMALWANLHASFPIGLALAAPIALEGIATAEPQARRRIFVQWLAFGLLGFLACGATPYGFGPLLVNFRLFGSGEAFRYIAEWQPLRLDATGLSALGLLGASALILLVGARRNLWRILPLALVAVLMIQHQRFIGLFGIVAVMLIAAPLARLAGWGPESGQPAALPRWTPLAALGLALACAGQVAVGRVEPNPAMTPAAALQAARSLGLSGPVFNDHDFGGYLIAQGVPTFVDGRTDQLFIDGFLGRLFQSAERPDGSFLALVESYGATWALVRPGSPEAARLAAAPDWRKRYEDGVAAVYARDQ